MCNVTEFEKEKRETVKRGIAPTCHGGRVNHKK